MESSPNLCAKSGSLPDVFFALCCPHIDVAAVSLPLFVLFHSQCRDQSQVAGPVGKDPGHSNPPS
jgi:hypothetical protein